MFCRIAPNWLVAPAGADALARPPPAPASAPVVDDGDVAAEPKESADVLAPRGVPVGVDIAPARGAEFDGEGEPRGLMKFLSGSETTLVLPAPSVSCAFTANS